MFLDEDIMNNVVTSILSFLAKGKEFSNAEDDTFVEISDSDSDAEDATGHTSVEVSNPGNANNSAMNLSDSDPDDEMDARSKTPTTPAASNSKKTPGSNRDKSGRTSKPPDVLTYTDLTASKNHSSQQAAERWKKALVDYQKLTGEKYYKRKGDRIDHFEVLIANLELEFEAKKRERMKKGLQLKISSRQNHTLSVRLRILPPEKSLLFP